MATYALSRGIDARSLIGTNIAINVPSGIYDILEQTWRLLKELGWRDSQFEHFPVFEQFTKESTCFSTVFTGTSYNSYDRLNLEKVKGDKVSYLICKCDFEEKDYVMLLRCKHVFHYHCVNDVVTSRKQCPYCRCSH